MMDVEYSVLELIEAAKAVVMAAPVRDIANLSCRLQLSAASCSASSAQDRSMELGNYGLFGLAKPGREEVIAMARIPHLTSDLYRGR